MPMNTAGPANGRPGSRWGIWARTWSAAFRLTLAFVQVPPDERFSTTDGEVPVLAMCGITVGADRVTWAVPGTVLPMPCAATGAANTAVTSNETGKNRFFIGGSIR